jgi:hypothetical protein
MRSSGHSFVAVLAVKGWVQSIATDATVSNSSREWELTGRDDAA